MRNERQHKESGGGSLRISHCLIGPCPLTGLKALHSTLYRPLKSRQCEPALFEIFNNCCTLLLPLRLPRMMQASVSCRHQINPMKETQPDSPHRRLQALLAISEHDRTEAQWDEINELEITLAPANREGVSEHNVPGKAAKPAGHVTFRRLRKRNGQPVARRE